MRGDPRKTLRSCLAAVRNRSVFFWVGDLQVFSWIKDNVYVFICMIWYMHQWIHGVLSAALNKCLCFFCADGISMPKKIVWELQGCDGKHLRWAKSYRCCEIKVWCWRKIFQKTLPTISYHSHGKWPCSRGNDRLVETHSTISWRVFQLSWDHFSGMLWESLP